MVRYMCTLQNITTNNEYGKSLDCLQTSIYPIEGCIAGIKAFHDGRNLTLLLFTVHQNYNEMQTVLFN